MTRILLVDDDPVLLQVLPETIRLRMDGVTVETTDSAATALELVAAADYDAVVTDIKLPGIDGLALLLRLRELRPDTPTLLITGHGEHDLSVQALRGGAYDFIAKPIDRDYFMASLNRAIQTRQLKRQVDTHRQALEEHAARLEQTVEDRTRDLRFLAEASRALAASLDLRATLRQLTQLAVPYLADWCTVGLLEDDGTIRLAAAAHVDPLKESLVQDLWRRYPPRSDPTKSVGKVLSTGRPDIMMEVTETDLRHYARGPAHLRLLQEIGILSQIVVPLIARGRTFGAVSLGLGSSGRRYRQNDVELMEFLARRAALAVDNARLYEREHHIAETLQRALLPRELPQLFGLSLDAAYAPGAVESEVGGDWYDAFRLPDGRLVLSVGDVTGKGLQAAVAMSQIRQSIRATIMERPSPAAALTHASRLLQVGEDNELATAVVAVLDPSTLTLTYASAGHPAPILGVEGGQVEILPASGLPLGTRLLATPTDATLTLGPGALLVLHTDGLTEHSRDIVQGETALLAAVAAEVAQPSSDRAQAIQERVLQGQLSSDDIAILTLSVSPVLEEQPEITVPALPSALPLVRQKLRQLSDQIDLDAQASFALQVAVGEAVTNAVEHAYPAGEGSVSVRFRLTPAALTVEIADHGRWKPGPNPGRQRGILLMRALVDRVEIESKDGGTTVRLTMTLPSPNGGPPHARWTTPNPMRRHLR